MRGQVDDTEGKSSGTLSPFSISSMKLVGGGHLALVPHEALCSETDKRAEECARSGDHKAFHGV